AGCPSSDVADERLSGGSDRFPKGKPLHPRSSRRGPPRAAGESLLCLPGWLSSDLLRITTGGTRPNIYLESPFLAGVLRTSYCHPDPPPCTRGAVLTPCWTH